MPVQKEVSGTNKETMPSNEVVTCFLRNRGEVLLLHRSDETPTYPGRWAGVSGYIEKTPIDSATREIREETGITDPELIREGEPLEVNDTDTGEQWIVHPYLFDCGTRDVRLNYESSEAEWVSPTVIQERRTVPGLWGAYQRVAPSVETVENDTKHGSAYISINALEALRDNAAKEDGEPVDVATRLLEARPGMTALVNRVNRVMSNSQESSESIEELAHKEIHQAYKRDYAASAHAAELLQGNVLTLSRSGTVLDAINKAGADVVVAESRPGCEGVEVAEQLSRDLDVTLVTDAAIAAIMSDVNVVLVGADSVLPGGEVVNKTGSFAAAAAADYEDVGFYAVASTDKISPDKSIEIEEGERTDLYRGTSPIDVWNPLFDVTPPDLVSGVVTEEGVLDVDDVSSIAEQHQSLSEW